MSEPQAAPTPTLTVDDQSVAWIVFDDPERSVNVLTRPIMTRLAEVLDEVIALEGRNAVRAVVVTSGKAQGFVAGADVDDIASIEDADAGRAAVQAGQAVFQKLADLKVLTVAAVHGICLGGGVEISLACRFRVGSDAPSTKIGLPEVQLGILPAWGGTTRLPRLIGLQGALDLILTGKQIDARRAYKRGFFDTLLPAATFDAAVREFVRQRLSGEPLTRAKRPLMTRLLDETAPGRSIVLRQARKRVLGQTGGHYPAPLLILDVIADTATGPVESGLAREAEAAGELIVSAVSKNLIHVFRLREAARKGLGVLDGGDARAVHHMGILGAGVMGGGVAQLAAYNDVRVRIKDIRHDAVQGALTHARGLFDKAVKRRRLERRVANQKMELISGGLDYAGFQQTDLVVEAVVERMDIKRSVLQEVEDVVREGCVLTSNTSSLSIDALAEALQRPQDFGGMHFFNPVDRMPLVEVVRGRHTSAPAVATIYALALKMKKVPVIVGDGAGFLVNRILGPYLNEAGFLLSEGASIEAVDRAAKNFGMPMGPIRLLDEVGLDIARHAGASLFEAFGERMKPSPVLAALETSKRLGRKGGLGFYRYEADKEVGVDPEIYGELAAAVPAERAEMDEGSITARLVLCMVNEAARTLEDKVAAAAADVDLGMIMGTGFPPFRGGLLRYADGLHPRTILARLEELQAQHGPRFEPAESIRRLAQDERTFYEAWPAHESPAAASH